MNMNPYWDYRQKPKCFYCGQFFNTEDEVKEHWAECTSHPNLKRCPTCGYRASFSDGVYCFNKELNLKIERYSGPRELSSDEWIRKTEPCPYWVEIHPLNLSLYWKD